MYAGPRESVSVSPTPAAFSLAKEAEEEDVQVKAQEQDGTHEQISAADYDPSLDRREDEQKRVLAVKDESQDVQMIEEEEEEDVDDMFAVTISDKPKAKKVKKVLVRFVFSFIDCRIFTCVRNLRCQHSLPLLWTQLQIPKDITKLSWANSLAEVVTRSSLHLAKACSRMWYELAC